MEYITRFMTRSFEKSVDYYILADKNYLVPKQKVHDYNVRVLSIPYSEFIDYVKDNMGVIEDDQRHVQQKCVQLSKRRGIQE